MITALIVASIILGAGVLFLRWLLSRDRDTFNAESVGQRVDRALYFKNLPDPCAEGHESLVHEFGQRRAPSGASVIVYEGSFCSVCTAPAPTPPWRDCKSCHAHITAGGLGLEFELEPCKRHARNAGWNGRRWSA